MYIDYSNWESYEYKVSTLYLDANNPRLRNSKVAMNQLQIMNYLIANEKVFELARKIAEEGYFVGESPIICIEKEKKIVLEGNRRTGALKLLQNPTKYLPKNRSHILIKLIAKNAINTDKKILCHIAPNRLLANPIIYSRHNGENLEKWKTGNQYAFVAEMYYNDGLSITDIGDVLNESISKVLKPLKAYNLFFEGQAVLSKNGIDVDVYNFNFTNLERFYAYSDGKKFLGIDFNEITGELIINLPIEEFENRILLVFKRILDADRFSREFNREEEKAAYIKNLKKDSSIDIAVDLLEDQITKGKTSTKRANLDAEKNKITIRKKRRTKHSELFMRIIPSETEVSFNNDKLDTLFYELKSLSNDKLYSFAVLLRSYLEQTLNYYVQKKGLIDDISIKTNEKRQKDTDAKISTLTNYLKGKFGLNDGLDNEEIKRILRFTTDKTYSEISLKILLDYFLNNILNNIITDSAILRNTKVYVENVKNELDLAVHNLQFTVDLSHNKRAWNSLFPIFEALSVDLID